MASSKVMSSSTRKSDPTRRVSSSSSSTTSAAAKTKQNQNQTKNSQNHNKLTSSTMTVDGILGNVYNSNPSSSSTAESTLLDAQITLVEAPTIPTNSSDVNNNADTLNLAVPKTVDDVWREIVAGKKKDEVMMKEEAPPTPEEDDSSDMMTLEDFLAKAGAVEVGEDQDVKAQQQPLPERLSGGIYAFDPVMVPPSPFPTIEGSIVGFGNGVEVLGSGGGSGRGKRGRVLMEPLDKAAQQRQRRMIKNRESAARSRERKQAYQVELESLAVRLEEENEQLMREKAESTKERFKQLMEKIVPVIEKRRPPCPLRRVHSMQW